MPAATPTFHAGERALQARVGMEERLAVMGPRIVRDHMPEQHRAFFALLPFLLIGTVDPDGQPLAGIVAGPPGFAWSPDARTLRIDALPGEHDPSRRGLRVGAPIGLLGIQPHTRRRNRMNGRVSACDGRGFTVEVEQSFGNCPRYIQAREPRFDHAALPAGQPRLGVGLDDQARAAVEAADTFFIATAHPGAGHGDAAQGVDVSHRGGPPGFIAVEGDVLTVPDYAGNTFFNTLGNLVLEPRCSVLLVDTEEGGLTWLQARAAIVETPAEVRRHAGAQRLLRLQVTSSLRVASALPLRWGATELAPEFRIGTTW